MPEISVTDVRPDDEISVTVKGKVTAVYYDGFVVNGFSFLHSKVEKVEREEKPLVAGMVLETTMGIPRGVPKRAFVCEGPSNTLIVRYITGGYDHASAFIPSDYTILLQA